MKTYIYIEREGEEIEVRVTLSIDCERCISDYVALDDTGKSYDLAPDEIDRAYYNGVEEHRERETEELIARYQERSIMMALSLFQ